jgi:hypothetical protein
MRYRAVAAAAVGTDAERVGRRAVRTDWHRTVEEARAAGERISAGLPDHTMRLECGRPIQCRLIMLAILLHAAALAVGIVAIVTTPPPPDPMDLLFGSMNPLALAFVTDIRIENRLDEPIWVTPIGTVGKKGTRRPLPVCRRRIPYEPSRQRGNFRVDPGERCAIYYDWDDINFSEVVVRTEAGRLFQLIANPDPTGRQYVQAPRSEFIIDDLAGLEPMRDGLRAAYENAQEPFEVRPLPPMADILAPDREKPGGGVSAARWTDWAGLVILSASLILLVAAYVALRRPIEWIQPEAVDEVPEVTLG